MTLFRVEVVHRSTAVFHEQMLLALDTIGVFKVAPVPARHHKAAGWAVGSFLAGYSSLYEQKATTASQRRAAAMKAAPSKPLDSTHSTLVVEVPPVESHHHEDVKHAVIDDVFRGGGSGGSRGPLASGHSPWIIPNTLASPTRGLISPQSPSKTKPLKHKDGTATIVDVENCAVCVHELASLYRRRLDAHMQHVVCCFVSIDFLCAAFGLTAKPSEPSSSERRRLQESPFSCAARLGSLHNVRILSFRCTLDGAVLVCWDSFSDGRLDRVEALWKFSRQLHRVVGPNHPCIDKAEASFQTIAKILVPNRRDYFKRR